MSVSDSLVPDTLTPPSPSPPPPPSTSSASISSVDIETEIISEDEMALLETALTLATRATSSSFHKLRSVSLLSGTRMRFSGRPSLPDIEDHRYRHSRFKSNFSVIASQMDKGVLMRHGQQSFYDRFRRKKGLSVTDLTSAEWCEKQTEFHLLFKRRKTTKAMRAGSRRHEKLEQEVIKRVKTNIKSAEDRWALMYLNFIIGTHQLLFEGLTRELPIIGYIQGVWLVGVIDEIRMFTSETGRSLTFVDVKTRVRNSLPAEAQQRNGRFQLMCYKCMWDNLVSESFPSKDFFQNFKLNSSYMLAQDIREHAAGEGFPAETLDDVVRYFKSTCMMLPPAHKQLLLRYELQRDHSLVGEDWFEYRDDRVRSEIQLRLEFWQGKREAYYVPRTERWKCGFCQFNKRCPSINNTDGIIGSPSQHTQVSVNDPAS